MRRLALHPDSLCGSVTAVEAWASRPGPGLLALRYVLRGATADLRLPPPARPDRADGLWRHTCFEAFVGAPPHEGYFEFNLAPSTQWAVYRFDGYRRGMRPVAEVETPRIDVRRSDEGLELRALVDLNRAPGWPKAAAWRVGLSAVVEEAGGAISHWALAHPPGRADFHHRDCFALELPETARP